MELLFSLNSRLSNSQAANQEKNNTFRQIENWMSEFEIGQVMFSETNLNRGCGTMNMFHKFTPTDLSFLVGNAKRLSALILFFFLTLN